MNNRETMQQALEELENIVARLGQEIEQEPQAKDCGGTKALPVPVAQPEQEPVAFYHPRSGFYWAKPTSIFAPTSVDVERLPLYTAPPAAQRPWVGLTDEEFIDAWHWGGCNPHIEGAHFKALYYYFEAKLKERNK